MAHPHPAIGIATAVLTLLVAAAACGSAEPVQPAARSLPFAGTTSSPAAPRPSTAVPTPSTTAPTPSAVVATTEPVAPVVAALPAPVVRSAPATTRTATPSPKAAVPSPKPAPKPAPKAAASSGCNSNYTPCVPDDPKDVDCQGGSGNGPSYVAGPVHVTGSDVYGLDADKDGIGCE